MPRSWAERSIVLVAQLPRVDRHANPTGAEVNVFSSPRYLRALDASCFDGAGVIEVVAADEHTIQTLVTKAGPCVDHLFIDFFEPAPKERGRHTVSSIPRFSSRSVAASEWASARGDHTEPSPFVDWRRFGEWSAFEAHVGQQRAKLIADGRRQTRRLEKELGAVRLSVDHDTAVFDQCIAWKSAQYQRSGARDLFADARHIALLRRLVDDDVATTESLWAGETLVAAHIGMRHDGRYSWWFPAYAPEHDRFSPGRLLLMALLRSSFERGDDEFDLLLGEEDYKWHVATDVRLVDSVGSVSLSQRVQRLRHQAAHRFPRAGAAAKRIRRRFRARVGR